LRVVRRFGVATASEPATSPASVAAVAAFDRVDVDFALDDADVVDAFVVRVARFFGAAASASAVEAVAVPAAAASTVASAFFRVVRRFGSAAALSAFAVTVAAVEVAAVRDEVRRARAFGSATAESSPGVAALVAAAGARSGAAGRGAPFGDWASWARSIASSSSGTSLHGSLDDERAGAWRSRSGRSCRGPRSPRP
jgi:hypothetical protein